MAAGFIQQCLHLQIPDMYFRNCIQIYVPVNAGEPVKVLILAPAACRPFKHLCGKLIFSFSQIRCQFELRRRKGILAVADIAAIQPQSQPALCSLEGYKKPFSLHALRHFKIFDIAGYRIETGRDLTRFYLFSSFPRILYIRILRDVIAFHLDVRRYPDIIPGATVILRLLKARDRALIILCIVKLPETVQALLKTLFTICELCCRSIIPVIGMRFHTAIRKIQRIFYLLIIKYVHIISSLKQGYRKTCFATALIVSYLFCFVTTISQLR